MGIRTIYRGILRGVVAQSLGSILIGFILTISLSCTKEGPAGPPGISADLSNPSIKPSVIFTHPPNNGVGPYELHHPGSSTSRPHFVVRFNKLMDTYSFGRGTVRCEGFESPVEIRIHRLPVFLPRDNAGKVVHGDSPYQDIIAFDVFDSATSYFRPYFKVGSEYRVTITPDVRDINGNTLSQPYTFRFTPEPRFRVVRFFPETILNNVSTSGFSPSITFNSPVDSTVFRHLSVIPSPGGKWFVVGDDSLTAQYRFGASQLQYDQAYTFGVDAAASDVSNNLLGTSFTSAFRTPPFGLRFSTSMHNAKEVELRPPFIGIYFTGLVDTSSIRRAFSISPSHQLDLDLMSDAVFLRLPGTGPSSEFVQNTTYTVRLDSTVRAFDGTRLSQPITIRFTTVRFKVAYTNPTDFQYRVSRDTWISVGFNSMIDTGSVRAAFNISPPTAGQIEFGYGNRFFSFRSVGSLEPNTAYRVTIGTSLRSQGSNHLLTPHTFTFVTDY